MPHVFFFRLIGLHSQERSAYLQTRQCKIGRFYARHARWFVWHRRWSWCDTFWSSKAGKLKDRCLVSVLGFKRPPRISNDETSEYCFSLCSRKSISAQTGRSKNALLLWLPPLYQNWEQQRCYHKTTNQVNTSNKKKKKGTPRIIV